MKLSESIGILSSPSGPTWSSSIFEAINRNIDFSPIGLKEVLTDPNDGLAMVFEVEDEEKFMIAILEYSIVWETEEAYKDRHVVVGG